MKINLSRKTIAKGLLGFIDAQVLTVTGGLYQRYLLPHEKPVVKDETKTVFECHSDALYGIISQLRHPIKVTQDENKMLSISVVGTTSSTSNSTIAITTGPSGDMAILDSTIDFPV